MTVLAFFSNLDDFYFFSSLTAVARTSKIMLNKSHESGHCCLSIILGEMLSAFMMSAEYDATCRVVLNGLCYVEEGSLYSDFLETFYHKWVSDFVTASIERIILFLFFHLYLTD